ncbi:ATP-NAD kinase family protein [Microbacterium sp. ASV49]|uniref:NAD(+)/NADH kinase n=1 Tax=Microbacterium candidum TaxID=3041922 RepID=A0ABT7MYA0_9MICO|nr:NAD(+)/NADH kinase [Microbacterium sp. ASV49]MDL9979435.1 NAD(+)/NADH kinase [Microbacterium sp. ASV49]
MLGLIVNPIAGVGGPAGLAGSDGADVQRSALARGASARASARAALALGSLPVGTTVLTAAGAMGEDAVRAAGLEAVVVFEPGDPTSSADTTAATRALVAAGATLILFAGGDGTARDVAAGLWHPSGPLSERQRDETSQADLGNSLRFDSLRSLNDRHVGAARSLNDRRVGTARSLNDRHVGAGAPSLNDQRGTVAALGIPAGVKMYSPVFAVSPRAAGGLAAAWLDGDLPGQQREVLDIDEAAMRRARVEPRLYALMNVPYRAGRTQARKAPTPTDEKDAVAAAARGAASMLRPGVRYLLGPGGTMAELARALGVEKTPLGVDVVLDGELVLSAASEQQLLDEIAEGPAQAVVSVIGGQGFLLGRGNQQLSARVLRALGDGPDGRGPLLVVAPESKLVDLRGRALLVDTGDLAVDAALAGFVRVVTGAAASSLYPVHAPELMEENHAS